MRFVKVDDLKVVLPDEHIRSLEQRETDILGYFSNGKSFTIGVSPKCDYHVTYEDFLNLVSIYL
jgi:hypothetical protein